MTILHWTHLNLHWGSISPFLICYCRVYSSSFFWESINPQIGYSIGCSAHDLPLSAFCFGLRIIYQGNYHQFNYRPHRIQFYSFRMNYLFWIICYLFWVDKSNPPRWTYLQAFSPSLSLSLFLPSIIYPSFHTHFLKISFLLFPYSYSFTSWSPQLPLPLQIHSDWIILRKILSISFTFILFLGLLALRLPSK